MRLVTALQTQQKHTFSPALAVEEIVYRRRDVVGIAKARVSQGLTMASRLRRAGLAIGSEAAGREAFLLEQCAAAENIWVAANLDSVAESGLTEMYDGVGILAGCGSRLCSSCCADLRRRSRARARAGIAAAGIEAYEARRFVTLTTPTPQGASVLEAISFINGAFRRLGKKAFWLSRVRGAIKGVEFTVGKRGYHPHIHLIVIGKYLERDSVQEAASAEWRAMKRSKAASKGLKILESLPVLGNLQDVWEECLLAEAAARGWLVAHSADDEPAVGVWLDWRGAGGGVMVDVRTIRPKRSRGFSESDNATLTDALNEVLKYTTKSADWLQLPDDHLVEVAIVRRWARMFEVLGACRPPAVEGEESPVSAPVHASLDTPGLSAVPEVAETSSVADGEGMVGSACDGSVSPASKLRPAESLRVLGASMEFSAWCALVQARLEDRRLIRRRLLAQQFEHATFWLFDGHCWGMIPGVEDG